MPNDPELASAEMRRLLSARTSYDRLRFEVDGETVAVPPDDVVAILGPALTERRRAKIEAVLDRRTYSLAVVLDGMVDTGNVAAVMRSADAFGVQAFHAIDRPSSYKHSKRTTQGAEKWLDRWRWSHPEPCVAALRESGLRVVAAHPAPDARPLESYDFSRPTAVVFGNELEGVAADTLELVDESIVIRMDGFSQSLNVSVAAAIVLHHARNDREARLGHHGDLSPQDRARLRAVWYLQSTPHAEALIRRALQSQRQERE